MTLILNRENVIPLCGMQDCMNAVEKAFSELTNGTAVLPLRIGITPPDGLSLYMPAYLKEMKALACKVVTVYKNNPSKHHLPTTIGKVLLQDPETGEWLRSFTIVTTRPNDYMAAIHDRMPVIIPPDRWATWLDRTPRDPGELRALLEPDEEIELDARSVSPLVNNVRNDGPLLIEPWRPGVRPGLPPDA